MRVLEDTQVGNFVLIRTTASGEDYYGGTITKAFWFQDTDAKIGDLIILYTKRGNFSKKENKSGTVSHFYYMGSSEAIWTRGNTAAVLIESKAWFGEVVPTAEQEDEAL